MSIEQNISKTDQQKKNGQTPILLPNQPAAKRYKISYGITFINQYIINGCSTYRNVQHHLQPIYMQEYGIANAAIDGNQKLP